MAKLPLMYVIWTRHRPGGAMMKSETSGRRRRRSASDAAELQLADGAWYRTPADLHDDLCRPLQFQERRHKREGKALYERTSGTVRAASVCGLRNIAFAGHLLHAMRRANDQRAQDVVYRRRDVRGRESKKHVAQHGNEPEPSDGAPMLANSAHVSNLGSILMPINR
jgi:hypothetical protein